MAPKTFNSGCRRNSEPAVNNRSVSNGPGCNRRRKSEPIISSRAHSKLSATLNKKSKHSNLSKKVLKPMIPRLEASNESGTQPVDDCGNNCNTLGISKTLLKPDFNHNNGLSHKLGRAKFSEMKDAIEKKLFFNPVVPSSPFVRLKDVQKTDFFNTLSLRESQLHSKSENESSTKSMLSPKMFNPTVLKTGQKEIEKVIISDCVLFKPITNFNCNEVSNDTPFVHQIHVNKTMEIAEQQARQETTSTSNQNPSELHPREVPDELLFTHINKLTLQEKEPTLGVARKEQPPIKHVSQSKIKRNNVKSNSDNQSGSLPSVCLDLGIIQPSISRKDKQTQTKSFFGSVNFDREYLEVIKQEEDRLTRELKHQNFSDSRVYEIQTFGKVNLSKFSLISGIRQMLEINDAINRNLFSPSEDKGQILSEASVEENVKACVKTLCGFGDFVSVINSSSNTNVFDNSKQKYEASSSAKKEQNKKRLRDKTVNKLIKPQPITLPKNIISRPKCSSPTMRGKADIALAGCNKNRSTYTSNQRKNRSRCPTPFAFLDEDMQNGNSNASNKECTAIELEHQRSQLEDATLIKYGVPGMTLFPIAESSRTVTVEIDEAGASGQVGLNSKSESHNTDVLILALENITKEETAIPNTVMETTASSLVTETTSVNQFEGSISLRFVEKDYGLSNIARPTGANDITETSGFSNVAVNTGKNEMARDNPNNKAVATQKAEALISNNVVAEVIPDEEAEAPNTFVAIAQVHCLESIDSADEIDVEIHDRFNRENLTSFSPSQSRHLNKDFKLPKSNVIVIDKSKSPYEPPKSLTKELNVNKSLPIFHMNHLGNSTKVFSDLGCQPNLAKRRRSSNLSQMTEYVSNSQSFTDRKYSCYDMKKVSQNQDQLKPFLKYSSETTNKKGPLKTLFSKIAHPFKRGRPLANNKQWTPEDEFLYSMEKRDKNLKQDYGVSNIARPPGANDITEPSGFSDVAGTTGKNEMVGAYLNNKAVATQQAEALISNNVVAEVIPDEEAEAPNTFVAFSLDHSVDSFESADEIDIEIHDRFNRENLSSFSPTQGRRLNKNSKLPKSNAVFIDKSKSPYEPPKSLTKELNVKQPLPTSHTNHLGNSTNVFSDLGCQPNPVKHRLSSNLSQLTDFVPNSQRVFDRNYSCYDIRKVIQNQDQLKPFLTYSSETTNKKRPLKTLFSKIAHPFKRGRPLANNKQWTLEDEFLYSMEKRVKNKVVEPASSNESRKRHEIEKLLDANLQMNLVKRFNAYYSGLKKKPSFEV